MPPLSKKVIAWVAAGIVTATVTVVLLLWSIGTRGLEGETLVTARFDALRVGLSIGLGGGGLFALYLAWRRQHSTEIGLAQKQQDQADVARAYELQRETFDATRQHQERVATATERDAEARRVTDLYTKAVEQLGSEKAPVRLGGLYALERLAQDHVEQRQTIVNVLCAYLRMPYTLPGEKPADNTDDKLVTAHRERTQEREVRLAAQRILADHLSFVHPNNPTFWTNIELDLTGATLINFNLIYCNILNAQFGQATFTGGAMFINTTFKRNALFNHATFTGNAQFDKATFTGDVWFDKATFTGDAFFKHATFKRNALFNHATFTGNAQFDKATFTDYAMFNHATFMGDALFNNAAFEGKLPYTGSANFSDANFTGDARFGDASFTGDARFNNATFTSNTDFENATFMGNTQFNQATLPSVPYTNRDSSQEPWIDFHGARFAHDVPPEVERFVSRAGEEARDDGEA